MPLTDTQVKNAKPAQRPPRRRKGAPGNDSEKSTAPRKSTHLAKGDQTQPGNQPKSYKPYDGKNLYIEIFRNGSKIWRFRYKCPQGELDFAGQVSKGVACEST